MVAYIPAPWILWAIDRPCEPSNRRSVIQWIQWISDASENHLTFIPQVTISTPGRIPEFQVESLDGKSPFARTCCWSYRSSLHPFHIHLFMIHCWASSKKLVTRLITPDHPGLEWEKGLHALTNLENKNIFIWPNPWMVSQDTTGYARKMLWKITMIGPWSKDVPFPRDPLCMYQYIHTQYTHIHYIYIYISLYYIYMFYEIMCIYIYISHYIYKYL